jgi:hypothetical protein
VVITGRQAPPAAARSLVAPINAERDDARTSLELVAECDRLRRDNQRLAGESDRLRRDNQRLSGEVTRLRAEIARMPARPDEPRTRESTDLDDAATRFSLLELDL